jgi:hypothetical protein
MWGSWWLDLLLGLAAGLVLAWLVLIVALVIVRPRGGLLREALQLLPDLLRLLPRLAADRSLPGNVRVGLALLLAYLALGRPAFSGQLNWCYFMLRAAGSGAR